MERPWKHFYGSYGFLQGFQKVAHKLELFYCLRLKKIRGVFLIMKIRVIIVSKKILEIEIFWGYEVLKLHY